MESYIELDRNMIVNSSIGDVSVDATHPNDAGFACMARGIGTIIRCALEDRL